MQLPSAKKARLSAEAISKSFNFEANESRAIIAQIFNFNSWEQLIKKLQNVESTGKPVVFCMHRIKSGNRW